MSERFTAYEHARQWGHTNFAILVAIERIKDALEKIDARLDMIESRGEVEADLADLVRRDSLDDGIEGV